MKLQSLKSSKFEAMSNQMMSLVRGGERVFTPTKTKETTDGGKTWHDGCGDKDWYNATTDSKGNVTEVFIERTYNKC